MSMKIIIFGARGDVGRRLVKEAVMRGHQVTAVVRNESQINDIPSGVINVIGNVLTEEGMASLMQGHDLAISALRPSDGQEELLVPLTRSILTGAEEASTRAIIVGGAASLKVPNANGHTVLTAPNFLPEAVVPIATACQAQFELLQAQDDADWTYLCPPAMLTPGERKGHYRIGSDTLAVDEDGNSAISMEDFAVAMLDEAENPKHQKQRFTVAY
jgi:putative NADH-flavin reductase